jgi:hypothetical protein
MSSRKLMKDPTMAPKTDNASDANWVIPERHRTPQFERQHEANVRNSYRSALRKERRQYWWRLFFRRPLTALAALFTGKHDPTPLASADPELVAFSETLRRVVGRG